ncbi:hypothetical protein QTP86_014793 [Hemibagrus guttatus]|nr:hypothetical protein QTP86_014793 [Hemibagrus guttatus]
MLSVQSQKNPKLSLKMTNLKRPKAGRWRASSVLWQSPFLEPPPVILLTRRRNCALRCKEGLTLRAVETNLARSLIHKPLETSSERPNF